VEAVEGPLQPLAVTAMVAFPLKEEFQVTVPLPSIVPADDGVIDQLYPVALLAEVV